MWGRQWGGPAGLTHGSVQGESSLAIMHTALSMPCWRSQCPNSHNAHPRRATSEGPPKVYNSAPPPTVAYTTDVALAVAANAAETGKSEVGGRDRGSSCGKMGGTGTGAGSRMFMCQMLVGG